MSSIPRARLANDNASISLTEPESQLCTHLDNFTKILKERNHSELECCIAGGWVRDKLLGLESNDIDVALSSMMGFPFALQFSEYLQSQGVEVTRVTKVESRAEQSKHLETAKVATLGLDLDFVNLRSEEYADDSRIPTKVEFGTKLQDTLRRDITINALLYNIHTRIVEDHTKKGLDDLRNGIIRTPLPPRQTFLDDPLRILRCVRFASRFNYQMVPELEEAAKDPEIQAALDAKITRERIGDEIHKMMKGPSPLHSIQLIDSLSLHRSIFTPPASGFPPIPVPSNLDRHTALTAAALLNHFLSPIDDGHISGLQKPHSTLLSVVQSNPSIRRRLYLASALTPFKSLNYMEKKKQRPVIEACIREALKLGVQEHYLDGIPPLFSAHEMIREPVLEKFIEPSQRVALGLLLREKRVHNPLNGMHWTSTLLFSLIQDLVPLIDSTFDNLNVSAANNLISLYSTFTTKIEELNLPQHIENPPLLNGREVTSILSAPRPGPWTGEVLNEVIRWQLDHPEATKEEAITWLKEEVAAGRISADDGGGGQGGPKPKKLKVF